MLLALIGFVMVGFALGLLGGGGGILAFPVLVYLLHVPPGEAAPMALPVVGIAAAVGAFVRWRRGQLQLRLVVLFALCSILAALVTPRLGHGLSGQVRIILSITTMLAAAAAMWLRSRMTGTSRHRLATATLSPWKVVPAALIVGSLTGLIGVGGGFLIVPALTGVLAMPMAEATAASLALITLNCLAAGIGYWGQLTIEPLFLAEITAAALVGMMIGTRIAPRFPARILTRGFAVLLVTISLFTLWREFGTPPS